MLCGIDDPRLESAQINAVEILVDNGMFTGLVEDDNLLEWEVMIIGWVFEFAQDPLCDHRHVYLYVSFISLQPSRYALVRTPMLPFLGHRRSNSNLRRLPLLRVSLRLNLLRPK